jgi:hypothetical protein
VSGHIEGVEKAKVSVPSGAVALNSEEVSSQTKVLTTRNEAFASLQTPPSLLKVHDHGGANS